MLEGGAWPFPAGDPYPAYRLARERGAVRWEQRIGAYLVLDHEQAAAVLGGDGWSSDLRRRPQLRAAFPNLQAGIGLLGGSLLLSDPPAHARLRGAVEGFFTPDALWRMRACVAGIARGALAPLAEGQPVELMGELAHPISAAVVAELFDVGLEGAELLREEAPTLAWLLELDPTPAEVEAIWASAMSLVAFLVPLLARRRTDPGEDLLSALLHPPGGAPTLGTEEIVTMCLLLLAAGYQTAASAIGNGALALLAHPEQLQWLSWHPEGTAQAVEELLRYDSPVQVVARVASRDVVLGDVTVSRGQPALVVLGAANRDPARHPDPERLDLTRRGPSHLAFGHGAHHCLGAGLARLEARETFAQLARWWTVRARPTAWAYEREDSHTLRTLRSLYLGAGYAGRPAPVAPVRAAGPTAGPWSVLAA